MSQVKAVISDYIGTLTNARCYSMEASTIKLYEALVTSGFQMGKEAFLAAYAKEHEKYRLIRYGELREVTNAVWVSEALRDLGFEADASDPRMTKALDVFFEDFISLLELRPCAEKMLGQIETTHKLGLVSNFTYAPVVHNSLKKLGISRYFDVVVVSGDCGWRKPHKQIFEDALQQLDVRAEETIFIGDSPLEDIKGAAAAGMKTVFVHSQFFGSRDLQASGEKPDFVTADLAEIYGKLAKF
ncbi:MAG: HAD family hydrolase [Candidatus Bathyarchaeota archaeon]|nr:HAD family hydrolase [Candidatus Bathyarchaeota archaeon]